MRKIKKIEPTIPALPVRKKVAAYCRISMETERMSHSLSAQVSYYSEIIQKNPEWEYAGVYADNSVSGTSAKRREEFQRLLADCEAGKIDIVLTKSISRFARNTVDLLETVRHLKSLGIEVRFEKERINSLSGDGELMLTILASFAQEESRSISENVKWGTRKRFQQGIPNGRPHIFGYRWEKDQLVIEPSEAAIVRRIFQNFLDGKSRLETEREFAAEGITTAKGCRWEDSNIRVVLTNITYTGNLLFQKEYIADPISKKRKKNRGELPQYFCEGTHEAIIDKATFDYVQEEMARRKELGFLANKSLNLSCFSGKIKCGICGRSYIRSSRKRHNYVVWCCTSTKGDFEKSCGARGVIPEKKLKSVCAEALGLTEFDENIFSERIEKITVSGKNTLAFLFKDGKQLIKDCTNTGHKDCWTEEYRARVSAYRKKNGTRPPFSTVFTGQIKCAECGNNFRKHTQKDWRGEKRIRYSCATKGCSNNCVHEEILKDLSAKALGIDEFDEAAFKENIDHITIAKGGKISFHFANGETHETEYDTKRKCRPHTEEEKAHMREIMKAKATPEKRQYMSELMKRLRKECQGRWKRQ